MIVQQAELRANIKKYFDLANEGEPIIVPRRENKNVIILSEREYNELAQQKRVLAYSSKLADIWGADEGTSPDDTKKGSKYKSYLEVTDIRTDNLERLDAFESFGDNWNGNGADPFDKRLIKKVRDILKEQDIQPEIFPSATGAIGFEYTNSRRDFMSIEVSMEKRAEVFLVMYNGREISEYISADAVAINKRVKEFYE